MEKKFGDHTLPETYRRNLRSLRKSSTESYQYAARVAEAVRKGFPGIHGDLFNELCVEHMINGIEDQDVAYDVLSKRPKSLEEAINLLTWHHSCKRSLRSTKPDNDGYSSSDYKSDSSEVRRINQKRFVTEERLQQFGRELRGSMTKDVTQSVMDSVKTLVETNCRVIREEFQKLKGHSSDVQSRQKQDTKCYNCNEFGHIARNCPLPHKERTRKPHNANYDSRQHNSQEERRQSNNSTAVDLN
jgi:hypothetical protein